MLSVRISSCRCTREVWRARGRQRSSSRRSQIKLESLETLQLNSMGTFRQSVTARRYTMVTPKELDRTCPRAIFLRIDFYESKLKRSVKRKPNSRYYDIQIIIIPHSRKSEWNKWFNRISAAKICTIESTI